MSKILEASCVAGVVMIGVVPVPGVTILSQGVGPSTGVVILQGEDAYYVAKISPDLASTLDSAISALTQAAAAITGVATALTAIGAGMTGPTTAPPPSLPASVADLVTKSTAITAQVTTLTTLRAALK